MFEVKKGELVKEIRELEEKRIKVEIENERL